MQCVGFGIRSSFPEHLLGKHVVPICHILDFRVIRSAQEQVNTNVWAIFKT